MVGQFGTGLLMEPIDIALIAVLTAILAIVVILTERKDDD
jgi:hypothetical protein